MSFTDGLQIFYTNFTHIAEWWILCTGVVCIVVDDLCREFVYCVVVVWLLMYIVEYVIVNVHIVVVM